MKNLKKYILLFFFFIFFSISTFAHFGSKGPYGGTVTCSIVYDTTVYLGTAEGGVYESTTSKLVAWRPRPVGLKSGKITALAHSGKYLFAGTADSGVYIFNGYSGSDRYWQQINNGIGTYEILSLIALDSTTLLAGTNGGGVYKTTNKGASWDLMNNTDLNGNYITGFAKGDNYIFLLAGGGPYISSDNGQTWTLFNDLNTSGVYGATSLSYNSITHELMLSCPEGMFRATVAATNPVGSYTKVSTGLPASTAVRSTFNNGTAWILATDKGIFLSPVNSITWTASNNGLSTMDINTAVAFQTSLVAGTKDDGIFKANISSPTWVVNNFGFNNIATYSMACTGTALVVASTEKGVFVSRDLANTYKRANKGLTDSLHVNELVFWGTKLLAATKNAGVFISADTGATWVSFNNGLSTLNIQKIVTSPTYAYLYNVNGEIFFSTGTSWTASQGSLPSGVQPTSVVFYGNSVALGTYGNGVYFSHTGSTQWTNSNTGLTNLNVTSLAVRGKALFSGTDGAGVFVSDTTNPFDWKKTALTSIAHTTKMGLDGNRIQAMATYGGYVFASYKGGLLATSDLGTTWIEGGNQFNLPSYTNVNKIDFVSTRVFVTTENNSLYSNGLSELPPNGIEEIKNNIGSFTVYPNPSSGIIHLDLSSIDGTEKQIIVYDLQGRKVHEVYPADQLSETLKINVAAGMYYIQVFTDKGSAAQKISIE